MSSEVSRMVWFHPVDVTKSLDARIGGIATAIRARGVVSGHSAPKLPQSVLVCIDARAAKNAAIRRRSLRIVRAKLEQAHSECSRQSGRLQDLESANRELSRENSELVMRVAALEQILRNAGLEVPEDPPPEALPRGPRVHLLPGSFENGRRR